ncbi:ApeA N-terminal domain 1-containing protein [Chromobacterium haemolyticum]|uniref:ApeA N-terminal domain 1-containing protein n=1 Tax=Chromobacterium haemolyticum TaxID=394935 RepID=UPI0011B2550F|nr:HEPN domain-containing protein [Chromobacterium haemolyticum]
MTIKIDFTENYKYTIQIHHEDFLTLGEATLQFGSARWPHIYFEDWQASLKLVDKKKYDQLKAVTKDRKTFTLFNCSVTGRHVSVDCIVAGDVTGKFKSIQIRFNDISEWFMPFRTIAEKLNANSDLPDKHKQICEVINTPKESFNFKSEPVLQITKSGEDHTIHEHTVFIFECINDFFSEKDLKKKPHELSTLLSILIAMPVYIINIQTECTEGRLHDVFFPTFKNKDQDSEKNHFEYFIPKQILENRWRVILENYYNSDLREISWTRLSGMQRYEGFWEYKALGYVSLLDKYVDLMTKDIKKKQTKKEELRESRIKTELQKISPKLTENQESSIFDIIINCFMNGKKPQFKDKYNHVLENTDLSIRSIINLSNTDFIKIKEIRDAIAHGDAPNLIELGHGKIDVIINKIALLLTYWAFVDFGLNKEDFLKCLSSHSQLVFRADIDRVELARETKSAGFFIVPKEKFDQLSKIKRIKINSCFIIYSNGEIEYSESHTISLKSWLEKGISGVTPIADIFNIDSEKIQCWGVAYIECEKERLEIFQSYFINA